MSKKQKQPAGTFIVAEELEPLELANRVEIEYNELSEGFAVYQWLEGKREDPPLVWHDDTLDGAIKRLAQERKVKVIIRLELVPV